MIVLSALLLLVAVVTLVIGILGNGLQMISVSIASAVLAGIALTIGVVQGRKKATLSPEGATEIPSRPEPFAARAFDAPAAPPAASPISEATPRRAESLRPAATPAGGRPLVISEERPVRSGFAPSVESSPVRPQAPRAGGPLVVGSPRAAAPRPAARPTPSRTKATPKPATTTRAASPAKTTSKPAAKPVAPKTAAAKAAPKTASKTVAKPAAKAAASKATSAKTAAKPPAKTAPKTTARRPSAR